ncbi:hypothetical protein ACET3Z_019015 [Daucus carota]
MPESSISPTAFSPVKFSTLLCTLHFAKSIEAEGVGDMTEGDGAKLVVMKKEMMVKRQRNQTLRKEDEKIPLREINKRIKRRRVAQLLMEQKIHVAG